MALMSANVGAGQRYVRDKRSCHVKASSSQMAHRKPMKKVPADSIYPALRQSICRGVGGSPEKLTTCKPRSIMPGVVPPKTVKSAKYCKYTITKVATHITALSLLNVNCPPSEPKSVRKPPYAKSRQPVSINPAMRRSSIEATGYKPVCSERASVAGVTSKPRSGSGGRDTSITIRESSRVDAFRPIAIVKEKSSSAAGEATATPTESRDGCSAAGSSKGSVD